MTSGEPIWISAEEAFLSQKQNNIDQNEQNRIDQSQFAQYSIRRYILGPLGHRVM
jgi:hypothetical protein